MLCKQLWIAIALLVFLLPSQGQAGDVREPVTNFTSESEPWRDKATYFAPLLIGKDKVLLAVGGALFMLNEKRQLRWKYEVGADINGFVYVPKFDSVYVIAMDLTWVAVNAKTGKKRWSAGANGRATYSEIQNYGKDKYVVVTDMTGYDSGFNKCYNLNEQNKTNIECIRTEPDHIELMQDKKLLGEADFPPNAQLAVVGNHVWAITNGKVSSEIQEIHMLKPEEYLKQISAGKSEEEESDKCD